eukprot:GHRR01036006.1.p2 GENE.GHRR01036006.1~~GHRR01036006.1.p2  ORF type:complete len:112 (-),score=3.63 GHRR01036006.1:67-402(-)
MSLLSLGHAASVGMRALGLVRQQQHRSCSAFRRKPIRVTSRQCSAWVEASMSLNKRIGFMGSGQMAEALARGLIDRGVVQPSHICCSDPAQARKELFRSLGATPYDSNLEV